MVQSLRTVVDNMERFTITGKPNKEVIDIIMKDNNITDKSKILMVGDNPDTDIQLGTNAGVQTCLVFTGNVKNTQEFNAKWTTPQPTYFMESFGTLN